LKASKKGRRAAFKRGGLGCDGRAQHRDAPRKKKKEKKKGRETWGTRRGRGWEFGRASLSPKKKKKEGEETDVYLMLGRMRCLTSIRSQKREGKKGGGGTAAGWTGRGKAGPFLNYSLIVRWRRERRGKKRT